MLDTDEVIFVPSCFPESLNDAHTNEQLLIDDNTDLIGLSLRVQICLHRKSPFFNV